MTRPIYEPSLPRADAELGYGNRQLFRRPAPVSEETSGELPFAYMQWTEGGDLATNSWAALSDLGIDWSDGYVNDAGLHEVIDDPLITTDLVNGQFHLQHEGVGDGGYYISHVKANFSEVSKAGTIGISININGSEIIAGPMSTQNFQDATWVLGNSPNQTITHTSHNILVADTNDVGVGLFHNCAGTVELLTIRFYIAQIAPYDANTGQFYPIPP